MITIINERTGEVRNYVERVYNTEQDRTVLIDVEDTLRTASGGIIPRRDYWDGRTDDWSPPTGADEEGISFLRAGEWREWLPGRDTLNNT